MLHLNIKVVYSEPGLVANIRRVGFVGGMNTENKKWWDQSGTSTKTIKKGTRLKKPKSLILRGAETQS